jgi:hypothetical protein
VLVDSSVHTVIDLLAAGSKVEGMNVRRLDVFFYGLFMRDMRDRSDKRVRDKEGQVR